MKVMKPKSDKEWQAESDARTLAEAEQIKQDASRKKAAEKAAAKLAKEKEDDLAALKKVGAKASGSNPGKRYKKPSANK